MRAAIKSLKHFPGNRIILADVKRLKVSIKAEGLDEAIKVAQLSDDAPKKLKLKAGDLMILWGHHRTIALTELGKKTVEAEVSIMTWAEAEAEYWREKVWPRTKNRNRYEFACHLADVAKKEGRRQGVEGGPTNAQLAARYGERPTTVQALLRFAKVDKSIVPLLTSLEVQRSWFTEWHYHETGALTDYPKERVELIKEVLQGNSAFDAHRIRKIAKVRREQQEALEKIDQEKTEAEAAGNEDEVEVLEHVQELVEQGDTQEQAEKKVTQELQEEEDETEAADASAFDWELVPSVAKIVQDMIATEKRLPDWKRASAIGKIDQVARTFLANRIRSYVRELNTLARTLEKGG